VRWLCYATGALLGGRPPQAVGAAKIRLSISQGSTELPEASANASGLAGRYATALFELADEQGAFGVVASDLEGLKSLLAESPELRRLIRSPVLTREEQARALEAVADRAGFSDLTRRFLGLLAHHRRLFALPEIIDTFEVMLAEHRGEVGAELISAVALSKQQIAAVREQLGKAIGQKVRLTATVDPDLLGGLIVRVGSRMIDASLRTKLHQLELAMRGAA
jgi:F-type H+-transporting ATPase subunit delta